MIVCQGMPGRDQGGCNVVSNKRHLWTKMGVATALGRATQAEAHQTVLWYNLHVSHGEVRWRK
jgi:hypothetical protein